MNTALNLLHLLTPESILVETILVVLIAGLFKATAEKRGVLLSLTLIGGLASLAALIWQPAAIANVANGMAVLDPLTRFIKAAVLGLSLVAAVYAVYTDIRQHFAEYLALILFTAIGMMLLAGTENLLMIFIALEMISIPLYILAGFQKKSAASAEAALKYFLVGGVSAAFLLFGLSLIYGTTGAVSIRHLAQASPAVTHDPLFIVGLVMAIVGFGFKVAAVPFHLWAPDVYEGAPTSSAALIASGSKVAGFLILSKLLVFGFAGSTGSAAWSDLQPGWLPLLALIATLSIIVGNLAALSQSNVKRIIAYSAIAQSGYMLLGLTATGGTGLISVIFYVLVYAVTALGAFGVVLLVEKQRGGSQLHHFDGLHQSSPGLALSMGIFMISLAGIPPLAGFFGKFYLFAGALGSVSHQGDLGLLWAVIIALAFNAVSLYYYLIVLKHVFVVPSDRPAEPPIPRSAATVITGLLALAVFVIGIYPPVLLKPIRAAARAEGRSLSAPARAQR